MKNSIFAVGPDQRHVGRRWFSAYRGNVLRARGDASRELRAMSDFLYFCPTCKTIYEIVRHRVRPPTEPICWRCQQDFPIADEGDWLTYREMRPRFERHHSDVPAFCCAVGLGVRHALQVDETDSVLLRRDATGDGDLMARPHCR